MQDSRLMANISKALTKRVLKLLKDEAKKNPEEYAEKFYSEFGGFVKEGIVSDYANQPDIAKLLRFSSSAVEADKLISLDEYISRCPPEQKQIYYLLSASRKNAQESPYFEVFKERGIECLFLFNNVDDFVMTNLGTYGGRQLVNAASSAVDLGENPKSKDDEEKEGKEDDGEKLSEEEVGDLVDWLSTELKGTAQKITTTDRLFGSPAIVLPSESVAMRRMMKNVNHQINGADLDELEPQHLQVNPKHPMIIQMFGMRNKDPSLAREYAEVLYRSAVLAAGLTDDPAEIVPQLHKVMEKLAKYNP
jgi:HSP90 family molecular chaperone